MDGQRCGKVLLEVAGMLFAASLLLQLVAAAQEATTGRKEQECYNYAGGHVYPGEAFRVPVSDHSLHLSKAKSEFPRHRVNKICVNLLICLLHLRTILLKLEGMEVVLSITALGSPDHLLPGPVDRVSG